MANVDPETADQVPENMPANMPAEIVRKVAEAMTDALDAAYDTSIYRWPQQEDIPPIVKAVLTAAAPLIAAQERERIASELHERAQEFVHATPESVAARRELMQAAKIAREAP